MKEENRALKILRIVIGLTLFISGIAKISSAFGGGTTSKTEYVPYKYGDIVSRENTVEGTKFKLSKGVEIVVEEQTILSKDEIEKTNQFNDSSNEIAVLKISFTNNSDEEFSYNIFGINYSSTSNTQLDYMSGYLLELPEEYQSLEDLSSGKVMPGNTVKKIRTIAVPDGEKVKTIHWDYFGDEFTLELPEE